MIVRPAPTEHHAWIAGRAKLVIGPTFGALEAVEDLKGAGPERILGMVGFDGWTPNAVCLHIALDAPIALRGLLRASFDMAFNQCRRAVVICQVLGNNERSLQLVRHLGFREIARVRDGWERGVDVVLFEMRRRECRFLPRNPAASVSDNRAREAA